MRILTRWRRERRLSESLGGDDRDLAGPEVRRGHPRGAAGGSHGRAQDGLVQRASVYHDAAIVEPPRGKPFVLVVLTRGIKETPRAHKLVADITRAVYRHAEAARRGERPRETPQPRRLAPWVPSLPGARRPARAPPRRSRPRNADRHLSSLTQVRLRLIPVERPGVPDLDRPVEPGGGEPLAVGAERHAGEQVPVCPLRVRVSCPVAASHTFTVCPDPRRRGVCRRG